MKLILLIILSLLFNGCTEKPCEPKIVHIQPQYPKLKTLALIPPYLPKYELKDGYIVMMASELHQASTVSQMVRKQNNFYVKQITEYNRRFNNAD